MATRRVKTQWDSLIESTYYRLAAGRQINIMDIGKVFDIGKQAMIDGKPLEPAIQSAVDKYTTASGC